MAEELTIDEKMAAGFAAQYAESFGKQIENVEPKVEPVIEPKVEPVIEAKKEPIIEPKVEPKVEPVIEPKVEPVKSFEELLAERSGGKFTKWEDIEQELTPKEVFANEKIKKLNEYAQKGIDVTSKEFLELQSIDFEGMNDVENILFEKWKRSDDGKGLSDKVIRHEINKKYNVDAWSEKEDSELTDDDIANREKMLRDSRESKNWLVNYKNERLLETKVDPVQAKAMADAQEQQLKNWDLFVDSNVVNKITKLSTPISYKDETDKLVESVMEVPVAEKYRKEVGEIMKQLPRNSNAFFDQFKKADGTRDHEGLALMMLKAKMFDEARALSYSAGAEQRALVIEKAAKNTNFKPAESQGRTKPFATIAEAQADAIKNMKIF